MTYLQNTPTPTFLWDGNFTNAKHKYVLHTNVFVTVFGHILKTERIDIPKIGEKKELYIPYFWTTQLLLLHFYLSHSWCMIIYKEHILLTCATTGENVTEFEEQLKWEYHLSLLLILLLLWWKVKLYPDLLSQLTRTKVLSFTWGEKASLHVCAQYFL